MFNLTVYFSIFYVKFFVSEECRRSGDGQRELERPGAYHQESQILGTLCHLDTKLFVTSAAARALSRILSADAILDWTRLV